MHEKCHRMPATPVAVAQLERELRFVLGEHEPLPIEDRPAHAGHPLKTLEVVPPPLGPDFVLPELQPGQTPQHDERGKHDPGP
jgi:hypothetical protein